MEPRLADLGLYVGFDTYVEFHLRGVEPGAELQADRQCADDFAVDVQRVSGICRAFRIEVVGQHVYHVAAEVDPAEVVGYVFDFQIRQVAAGQISDLAGQLLLQSRGSAEHRDEYLLEIFRVRVRRKQGQERAEILVIEQVRHGVDFGVGPLHLFDQFVEQLVDIGRGVLNLLKIHVFSVCGQRRRQPDVGFVEEGFDVGAVFAQFAHADGDRSQRQPEFVADDDAVRVDFRQVVIVVDTRSGEHTEQKQW